MQYVQNLTSALSTVGCKTGQSSNQLCGIIETDILDCQDVKLSCTNTGTATTYLDCNADQVKEGILKALQDLGQSAPQVVGNAVSRMKDSGLDPTKDFNQSVRDYYDFRCGGSQTARQTALVPRLKLQNCSGVDIEVFNTLTQTAVCAAGTLAELAEPAPPKIPLVPADGPGAVAPAPVPVLSALQITLIVCAVVLVLAIVIVLAKRLGK